MTQKYSIALTSENSSPAIETRVVCVLILCASLLLLASTGACQTESLKGNSSKPLDKVTLQLKWFDQFQFAGYYAALEKGFYKELGLDVNILEAKPNVEPVSAVVQDKADFGVGSSKVLLLRAQGYPVVALAAILQHSPLVILGRAEPGIRSVHDLKDKRLMMGLHEAELLAYLKQEGIPLSALKIVPPSFSISDLIDKKVDAISAYVTDQPFELRSAGVEYITFSPRSAGIDFYGDLLFTTEKQIREKPARVKAFLEASLRGWTYAMANQPEIVDLIIERYGSKKTRSLLVFEAEQMNRLMRPDLIEIGYMNPGRWRHIADTYSELGMLPEGFSLDGFLYDRNPKPDLTRLYATLAGSLCLLAAVAVVALWIHKLNGNLRLEIRKREKIQSDLVETNKKLEEKLAEVETLQEELREQAIRDPLTGLFNRRYLMESLDRELARAQREKYEIGFIIADVDYFKKINDKYGHKAGDIVLREMADHLRNGMRVSDILCRYGGEEFVVVAPRISLHQLSLRAEELRSSLQDAGITYNGDVLTITASFGIASFPAHGSTKDALISAADKALYSAKEAGRNRVEVAA